MRFLLYTSSLVERCYFLGLSCRLVSRYFLSRCVYAVCFSKAGEGKGGSVSATGGSRYVRATRAVRMLA